MPRLEVHSSAKTSASADQAWAFVRNFCGAWHPAIDTISSESNERKSLIRRFSVKGESKIYRERLTYFSDSDRVMGYTHIEGIKGVHKYDARIDVTPTELGATISMRADFSAPSPRAQEIADGTKVVFDAGTTTIAENSVSVSVSSAVSTQGAIIDLESIHIETVPNLALSAAGEKDETLCLFLHGIGGNRSNWARQMSALAQFTRVAAMDLRGYGDSNLGAGQSTVDDYCADILRVMQAFGAKKLVLCGLSYGAWIATSFAMRHPEKLAGLVLSGGCTGMSEAGPAERTAFLQSREKPLNAGQTPADFAQTVVDVIAGPKATDENRKDLQSSMEAISAATYGDALRCFTNPPERFDFSKLSLPVLLMTGEHDRLAPPAEIRAVAERIHQASPHPDVRFEVIARAGHVCNLEQPDKYNAVLAEFVARVVS